MKARFLLLATLSAGLLFPSLALAPACAQSTDAATSGRSTTPQSAALARFFADYIEGRLRDEPEFATNVGRHEDDDRWTDLSRQGRERHRQHLEQRLQQLEKFPTPGLSEQDLLSVNLLH